MVIIIYKIGRGEKLIQSLCIDSKTVFIITKCQDDISYVIYSVDENGNTKRLSKGNNPTVLENKSGYLKMCEEWRKRNE